MTSVPDSDEGELASGAFVRAVLLSESAVSLICVAGGAALIATRRLSFGLGVLLGWTATLLAGCALTILDSSTVYK